MSKLTKWKKEDWAMISENTEDDRPYMKIAIGEKFSNGEKTYVTEEIYSDIMESICDNNSIYKVYVNFNEIPKIVTYFNGMLVANNHLFEERKKIIQNTLRSMYAPDVIKAYMDLQKQNSQKDFMLSPAIEILRNRIKETTGEKNAYQLMFLKPIVEEFVTADLIQKEAKETANLDDSALRELVIAMISNNKYRSRTYDEWLKQHKEERTKELITNELIRRYLQGGI